MITEGTRVLWKESAHRLRATFQYFAESFGGKCALEMRHPFLYFVRLVPISEFLYANFSFTCVRCTYLLKSWCDRWTYASRSMRTPRFNPSNDVRLWPAEVTSSRVVVVWWCRLFGHFYCRTRSLYIVAKSTRNWATSPSGFRVSTRALRLVLGRKLKGNMTGKYYCRVILSSFAKLWRESCLTWPCTVTGHVPTLPWVRFRVWVRVGLGTWLIAPTNGKVRL